MSGYHPGELRDLWREQLADGVQKVKLWETNIPHPNIDYLGRGYNIIFGNVLETTVGGDKGYRHPIFQIDSSNEQLPSDWRWLWPKKVDVMDKMACDTSMSSKTATSSQSISDAIDTASTETVDTSSDIDAEVVQLKHKYAHTKSDSFKDITGQTKGGSNTVVITTATCSVYEASLNAFDYPEFDPVFKEAVDSLPAVYDHTSQDQYLQFISTYGTHVVVSVLMGARYGKFYIIDTDVLEDMERAEKTKAEKFEASAYVRVSYRGVGVGVGVGRSEGEEDTKAEEKEKALSNAASEEKTFSIGAEYNSDVKEWAAQSSSSPMPIGNKIMPLAELIINHLDATKGANMLRAYSDYQPSDVIPEEASFSKCYLSTSENTLFKGYNNRVSILAKCKQGFSAMGGSFTHLWNFNGDIQVDALSTSSKQLMEDLSGYHKLRLQIVAVKKLIQEGAAMLKAYADANNMDNLSKLFGKVTDPHLVKKFLDGKLDSLEMEKKDFLQGIGNGLAVFGNSPLGDMAVEFVKNQPLMKSILDIGKNLVGEVKQKHTILDAETLVFNPDATTQTPPEQQLNLKSVETHANILLAVLQTLKARQNNQGGDDQDKTQTLFDIDSLSNAGKEVIGSLANFLSAQVKTYMTDSLQKWSKFDANINDVYALFGDDIKKEEKNVKSTPLFQKVLERITQEADIHGNTLLGLRNSLSFLFPHSDDTWVCGGGTMGVEGTSKSSMGFCSAYCCSSGAWKTENRVWSRQNNVDMKKRTSEMVAGCSGGYSVVSGGIMISDYQEGRFVQVVTSRPDGDNGWKCGIEWSEEDYIDYPPSFKCYAKCARAMGNRVPCSTYSEPLVNGHASVQCGTNSELALSGGWDVQSKGITYFKRTQFLGIHPVEGARGFRCELGTSHDSITGSCFVRCCEAPVSAVEDEVVKDSQSCAPYWRGARVNAENGDLIPPGRQLPPRRTIPLTTMGNTLDGEEKMDAGRILVSQNGEFFARFHPFQDMLIVYEQLGCKETHTIARMKLFGNVKCSHEAGSVDDKIRSFYKYELSSFKGEVDAEEKVESEEVSSEADSTDDLESGENPDGTFPATSSETRGYEQSLDNGADFAKSSIDSLAIKRAMTASIQNGGAVASENANKKVAVDHEFAWMRPFLDFNLERDEEWSEMMNSPAWQKHFRESGGAFGILMRFFHGVSKQTHIQLTKNGLGVFFPGSEESCSEFEITKDNMGFIQLNDNGDLTFKDDEGNALHVFKFSNCRLFHRKLNADKSVLENGQMMFLNSALVSKNKLFTLVFLPGGALAVVRQVKSNIYCRPPSLIWTTGKSAQNPAEYMTKFEELIEFNRKVKEGWVVRLQEDNNLVMFDDSSNVMWSSKSTGMGIGKANLYLEDNGELQIVDAVGTTLWSARLGVVKSCVTLRQKLKIRSHRLGAGSELKPGEGGLISKNSQYIVFIQKGDDNVNNLELWRNSDEDCKGVRIATIRKNVNVLKLDPAGVYADQDLFLKLDGEVPLNEITLDDSGHLWAHGGRNHRREVSKSFDASMEL
eukprot:CAMPEP_0117442996 /NCGR_PEP_ID=MMETSP0759-20121206/4455_1 /TAXON_ID=63605 /ORGANISM="Percolomonas cosmopolitus, Strain WS" /LENGTH=1529 /DNA_ID=CAMNT_0005234933 /DNA_START=403 /DNA_END=4992 /DNA_ORIENTATION=+